MAVINNLNQDDVKALESFISERQKINSQIAMTIFSEYSSKDQDLHEKLDTLLNEVRSLNTKLDNIFGGSVLLNGAFVDLKKQMSAKG